MFESTCLTISFMPNAPYLTWEFYIFVNFIKLWTKIILFNIKLHLDSVSFAFLLRNAFIFFKIYSIINIFILPVINFVDIFSQMLFSF